MLASSVRTFSVHLENLISVTCFASSFTLEKHQRLYRSWICAKSRFWSIFFPWKLRKFSTSTNYGFLSPNLFGSFRESDLSNLLFDCKINLRDVKFEKIETQLRWIGERTGTPPWQPASRPAFFFFFLQKRKWKVKELWPLSVSELAAVGLHMYVCSCEAITWGGRHANISAVPERATV